MNLNLKFREQLRGLGAWVTDELDQLIAGIRSSWLVEHTEDDQHGDIHAHSLTMTRDLNAHPPITGDVTTPGSGHFGGDGRFGGNVTAQYGTHPVVIGDVGSLSGDGILGSGIDMTGILLHTMWVAGQATFKEFRLLWFGTAGLHTPFLVRDDTTLGGYTVQPGPITNIIRPCYLGTPTDAFSAGRWSGIFSLGVDSSNGYAERGRSVGLGEWTAVTFAAGNFTGSGAMTWTLAAADQETFKYMLYGKTMLITFNLQNTTVGGVADTYLQVAIPGGYTAAAQMWNPLGFCVTGGALADGSMLSTTAGTNILIRQRSGANWVVGADNTSVFGQLSFEIQ